MCRFSFESLKVTAETLQERLARSEKDFESLSLEKSTIIQNLTSELATSNDSLKEYSSKLLQVTGIYDIC